MVAVIPGGKDDRVLDRQRRAAELRARRKAPEQAPGVQPVLGAGRVGRTRVIDVLQNVFPVVENVSKILGLGRPNDEFGLRNDQSLTRQ
ncbi:MAG: hypothetical protein CAPSK01_001676 [Candidatus Accumulibacter vicinus]|uniref:Uncharacterized protein n=1 Tax=Candidatus Accumulibacter vicinus TaxID=2954382 RepID=A0A084Y277_9PROT|nr:MAG: hypothetical protein CAPSK01_001676 [Candidatus Accumulibacter vicinus]